MRLRRLACVVAVILVAVLIGATVGGGARMTTTSPTPGPAVVKGGKIVLAAQRWPQCLNIFVDTCSYNEWSYWSVIQYVMPRATELTTDGRYTNSPLITEYPSLANGDLTQSPFMVRYRIDPRAVWSDGTPITCADFEFTRNAIINTGGTYWMTGYTPRKGPGLSSIDCSDQHTVLLNFSAPYTDWPSVFGGATGVVLEKAAFPKEKDHTRVNLRHEMRDTIPFSGGPWRLQSWSENQAVLVPNANYWGHKPNLDQVTIVPETLDSATQLDDLLSGSFDAIFPYWEWSPSLIPMLEGLRRNNSNVKARVDPSVWWGIEGLWMNLSKPPFDDPTVRQALFWAVDRDAILRQIIGPFDRSQQHPSGCGVAAYPGGFWCDVQPFAPFHYDMGKVNQVMTAGGYARDAAGFWAKDGQEVSFEYATSMKPVRLAIQDLLKPGLTAAGFNVTLKSIEATDFYVTKLPHGDFQLVEFPLGQTTSGDPSPTTFLACDFIPSPANAYAGENVFRWCDQPATAVMKESDLELDPNSRRQLLNHVYQAEAQDFAPGVPLYAIPNVTAWRADKIAGPIGEWNGTFYGGFFNIDEWYCVRQGACG